MSFDLTNILRVIEQHQAIREEDPYHALEMAEAAARYTMGRTECTRQELENALALGSLDEATEEAETILQHFYGFLDDVQA